MQYQPFAAASDHVLQQGLQRGAVGHLDLFDALQPGLADTRDDLLQRRIAFVERAGMRGQIEDHEMQRAPGCIVRRLLPDG